jgi:hypothetical protein
MDVQIIWDLPDDPDGNYCHLVVEGHGISQEEVEEVLRNPTCDTDESRSSSQPITFGWTSAGRYIAVVWEFVLEDPKMIYPITAYEVPPPAGQGL